MLSIIFHNGRVALVLLAGLFMLGFGVQDTVDRMREPISLSSAQLLAQGTTPSDRMVTFESSKVFEDPIGKNTTVRKIYGIETGGSITTKFYVAVVSDKFLLIEGGEQIPKKILIAQLKPLTEKHRIDLLDDLPTEMFLPFLAVEVLDPDWQGSNLIFLGLGFLLTAFSIIQLRGLLRRVRSKSEIPTEKGDGNYRRSDISVAESHKENMGKAPAQASDMKVQEWTGPSVNQNENEEFAEQRLSSAIKSEFKSGRKNTGPVITLHIVGKEAQKLNLGNSLVIGRSQDCALSLSNESLAANRHAQLMLDRGVIVLTDLGSSSGTFLNGTRISGAEPLSDGDCITIGRSNIRVYF